MKQAQAMGLLQAGCARESRAARMQSAARRGRSLQRAMGLEKEWTWKTGLERAGGVFSRWAERQHWPLN